VDGNFYIDTTANDLYGPKASGAWPSGTSLIGPQGPAGADGAAGATGVPGAAGAAGSDGNTMLYGAGAPSTGTGVDGNFYIDTTANDLYGPKASGAWPSGTSLIGPQGPAGADGAPGGAGDIASLTHAAGSKNPPVDGDEIPLVDSAASFSLSKLTWANLKGAIKTYLTGQGNSWTKAQIGGVTALASSAGAVAIDLSLGNNFSYTPTENATLSVPTNITAGQKFTIYFTQHASSAKTLGFNSIFKSANSKAPAVSTTLGAQNLIVCDVQDSTHIWYTIVTADASFFGADSFMVGSGTTFNANSITGDAPHICEITNDPGNDTDSGRQLWRMNSYGAAAFGNDMHFCRYRGTEAAPTPVKSGDYGMSWGIRAWDSTLALSQSSGAFQYYYTEDQTGTAHGGKWVFQTTPNGSVARATVMELWGIGQGKGMLGFDAIVSQSPTAGVGYYTGAGGTVAQATDKSTGVTLNKVCGSITMNAAALGSGVVALFTLTNSAIAATDVIHLSQKSGGTAGAYSVQVASVSAGSCVIQVQNISGGPLSEALVINFAVIKGVSA
jgi:hypothetical protein